MKLDKPFWYPSNKFISSFNKWNKYSSAPTVRCRCPSCCSYVKFENFIIKVSLFLYRTVLKYHLIPFNCHYIASPASACHRHGPWWCPIMTLVVAVDVVVVRYFYPFLGKQSCCLAFRFPVSCFTFPVLLVVVLYIS